MIALFIITCRDINICTSHNRLLAVIAVIAVTFIL